MNHPAKKVVLSLAIILLSSSAHAHTKLSFLQDYRIKQDLHAPENLVNPVILFSVSDRIERPDGKISLRLCRISRPDR